MSERPENKVHHQCVVHGSLRTVNGCNRCFVFGVGKLISRFGSFTHFVFDVASISKRLDLLLDPDSYTINVLMIELPTSMNNYCMAHNKRREDCREK